MALVEDKVRMAEKYFVGTKYGNIAEKVILFGMRGDEELCETAFELLPSKERLYSDLLEKLKGKPVYDTLKKVAKKPELMETTTHLKALFSLGTHSLIECEKGNKEYMMLLDDIYNQIGQILMSMER